MVGRWVSPLYICLLPTMVGCTPPPCTPSPSTSTVQPLMEQVLMTVLNVRPSERGSCPKERDLLPSENKPPPARKQAGKSQEYRYRKHMCTRPSRICQPLQKCSPAPLKARARLLTLFSTSQNPGPWLLFLIKSVQKEGTSLRNRCLSP